MTLTDLKNLFLEEFTDTFFRKTLIAAPQMPAKDNVSLRD